MSCKSFSDAINIASTSAKDFTQALTNLATIQKQKTSEFIPMNVQEYPQRCPRCMKPASWKQSIMDQSITCNHCGAEWDSDLLLNTPFKTFREIEVMSGRSRRAEQIIRQRKIVDHIEEEEITGQTFANECRGRPSKIDQDTIHEAVRFVTETQQKQEEELMNTMAVQEGEAQTNQIQERIRYLTTKHGDLTEYEQLELDSICRMLGDITPVNREASSSIRVRLPIVHKRPPSTSRNIFKTPKQKNKKVFPSHTSLKRKLDI